MTSRDLTIRVEQHIARGLPASRIAAELDIDIDTVHDVWDRLDALDDEEAEPVLNPTMARLARVIHPPLVAPPDVAVLPAFWLGRPIDSYFGPAAPEVIEQLVNAVCPPRSARRNRKKEAA